MRLMTEITLFVISSEQTNGIEIDITLRTHFRILVISEVCGEISLLVKDSKNGWTKID